MMCAFIAGDGRRQAAPLLLEAGKRIEGLWSGHYTGIGVRGDDGTLRVRKTTGYSRHWEERFSCAELPGSMGFFHSRTGSGGDARYAHPFLAHDGSAMLVSQGSAGIFKGEEAAIGAIADALLDEGVVFSSADATLDIRKYPFTRDGAQVHVSDIVAEYGASNYRRLRDPLAAVRKTATDIREEAVSLFIFRDRPGHVYIANVNQRMCMHFGEDGAMLSSCALAMGDRPVDLVEMPPNTVADVTACGVKIEPLDPSLKPYEGYPAGLLDALLDWLPRNPRTGLSCFLDDVLKRRFPSDVLRHVPTTRLFEHLFYEGRLLLENEEVPCVADGRRALKTWISLKGREARHG